MAVKKVSPLTERDQRKNSREGAREKPWTFITNHAAVLSLLAGQPRITAREVAHEVGITERNVRIIISDLAKGGYVGKTREGRGVRYEVDFKKPMRHKTQRDKAVRHLLSILSASRPAVHS